MVKLFAGVDFEGRTRFIGDVARGAACGCLCMECGSPLVAKHGVEKEWHFAHEGAQERPECLAGALNLLRRLAIQNLQRRHPLELPRYRQRVSVQSSLRVHSIDVEWDVGPGRDVRWASSPGRQDPVASFRAAGVSVDLFVEVDERVQARSSTEAEVADLVFWCPLPAPQHLRSEELVDQHITREGRFFWRHLPDTHGLVAAAEKALRQRVSEDEQRAEESRLRADQDRQLLHEARRVHSEDDGRPAREPPARVTSPVPKAFDWAPGWKAGTSFIFYRLTDGSAWVFYQRLDGSSALAPWPRPEEGWDEALPRSVGVAEEVGVYGITSPASALLFLNQRSAVVRASSDPSEFEGL
jgi:hypothetical protein